MFNHRYLSFIAVPLMLMASTSLCRAKTTLIANSEAPLAAQATTQQQPTQSVDQEARRVWRESMSRRPLPKKGCFKSSYPSTEWQEVPCAPTSPYPNPPQVRGGKGPGANTVGNTSGDFSAKTTGVISTAVGSFTSVDVTGGADTNGFMLQLNTQFFLHSPACNGVAGCLGWQQFLYSPTQCGGPCVFMEYWLIGYGATCPSATWISDGAGDCWFNGPSTAVTAQTVADLTGVTLTATAASGGLDTVVLSTPSSNLHAVGQDSVLSLVNFWNTAEFNAFGDCCSSETFFNNPTTLVLKTSIVDGTTNTPSCGTGSFTAETNNLTLAPTGAPVCCPYGGVSPAIEFMESNAGHTATCGVTQLEGDPHLTTADGTHYDFQGAGEFVSLRDSDGAEIQTRQTPISTTFFPAPDVHDGLATCVSINTAVAARVGRHRVTFEPSLNGVPDPSGLQLRIDGALTSLGAQGTALGTGGRVLPLAGGGLEVNFPDGKTLLVTPEWWTSQSKWYLNVDVQHLGLVSGAGETSKRGIAGSIADGSWLPSLPNGASMGSMPTSLPDRYNALYKKFADAWRVEKDDSLFDYAPGTSTETFTMKDWPKENPPCVLPDTKPVEPASVAVAEAACRRVMDQNRHADCVFDVRATGNPGFAKTYLVTQRILADSTTTTLTGNTDPSQAGEWVTFTAFVAADSATDKGFPSGTVQFTVDGSNVGEPVAIDAKGRARWETSRLKVGTHRVIASYVPGADSVFLPSTSLETLQTVKRCFCEAEHENK